MTSNKFQFGHVYWATPEHRELERRIVIMIGREGQMVQFAFVDDLCSADVDMLCYHFAGREFCKLHDRDHDYNCSSVCELPAAQAAEIYAAINSRARR